MYDLNQHLLDVLIALAMQDYTQKGDLRGLRTLMHDIPYASPIIDIMQTPEESLLFEDNFR